MSHDQNTLISRRQSLKGLAAGQYRIGVRANHLTVQPDGPNAVAMQGQVELAEITGSETFVHVHYNEVSWVIQEKGVHDPRLGDIMTFYMDPARLYVFGMDDQLVAAPSHDIKQEVA